jgi:hypothetical protein
LFTARLGFAAFFVVLLTWSFTMFDHVILDNLTYINLSVIGYLLISFFCFIYISNFLTDNEGVLSSNTKMLIIVVSCIPPTNCLLFIYFTLYHFCYLNILGLMDKLVDNNKVKLFTNNGVTMVVDSVDDLPVNQISIISNTWFSRKVSWSNKWSCWKVV